MLDTHFYFGQKKVAIALEPDLLYNIAWWLHSTGADIQAAVTPTKSPLLKALPTEKAYIGDLEDFEELAAGAEPADHQLPKPAPWPVVSAFPCSCMAFPCSTTSATTTAAPSAYRGTLELLFDIGNIFLEPTRSGFTSWVHQWREER